jgi:hypothetical protein
VLEKKSGGNFLMCSIGNFEKERVHTTSFTWGNAIIFLVISCSVKYDSVCNPKSFLLILTIVQEPFGLKPLSRTSKTFVFWYRRERKILHLGESFTAVKYLLKRP